MADGVGGRTERIRPLDHRGDLAGCDEFGEVGQVVDVPFGSEHLSRWPTNGDVTATANIRGIGPSTAPPASVEETYVPFGASTRRTRPSRWLPARSMMTSNRPRASGDVLARVVDDVVGADRAYELGVAGAAHAGHRQRRVSWRAGRRTVPTPPEAPLTSTDCPDWTSPSAHRLQRGRRRHRQGGRLLERDARPGSGRRASSGAATYSAKPRWSTSPNTSSPTRQTCSPRPRPPRPSGDGTAQDGVLRAP